MAADQSSKMLQYQRETIACLRNGSKSAARFQIHHKIDHNEQFHTNRSSCRTNENLLLLGQVSEQTDLILPPFFQC